MKGRSILMQGEQGTSVEDALVLKNDGQDLA
jgi:hypothetical protein